MSSSIPTRRVTRATTATRGTTFAGKENATARTVRAAATRAKPSTSSTTDAKPTGLARVTASTAATRAKAVGVAASKGDPAQGKRKREALGEVPKPPENRPAKPVDAGPGPSALKGKEKVKELKDKFEGVILTKKSTTTTVASTATVRQPLRAVSSSTTSSSNTATARRTRSAAAQQVHKPQPPAKLEQVKEVVEAKPEEDAMAIDPEPVVQPKRFAAARASAASVPSSARPPPSARSQVPRRVARYSKPEEDPEMDRAFKKRRTSSDMPEEAAQAEVEVEHALLLTEPPEADPEGDEWDDLDEGDTEDPLMVSEYVVEIFEYLKQVELTTMPNPTYMESQKDLAWKMRGILTDWLIQVHSRFRLLPETLFLCVNLIDRFLSSRVVSLAKLQLVGITCMFVAAKVEEIVAPSAQNFLYCADSSYNESEILMAEKYILKTIDWNLSYPNPIHFLRRTSKADEYDVQVRTVAKYFLEIQCLEWRLIAAPPSLLAAASMWLARLVLNRADWTPNLAHYSSYPESALIPTANLMLNYVLKPIRHQSFFKKYASKKFLKASVFVREWALERWEEGAMVSLVEELPALKQMARETRAAQELAEAEAQAAATATEGAEDDDNASWRGRATRHY
ncbi:hypothetical protein CERSUDRAFT_116962 [Gelatoporia subvermispora B]|uniref:Uncharacterized protein n=1 Tax=Ceriporiopsis subvermispora (strain B) TaxID=914234 RepID=M2QRF4_CERS8|nr:hypothetical protein CERSUDRAFT_116962 [Gelatoporia subvermispora B]